jgi:hypothetical protein
MTWPSRFRVSNLRVKYGHETRRTRTQRWLRWRGPAATVNDRSAFSPEKASHIIKPAIILCPVYYSPPATDLVSNLMPNIKLRPTGHGTEQGDSSTQQIKEPPQAAGQAEINHWQDSFVQRATSADNNAKDSCSHAFPFILFASLLASLRPLKSLEQHNVRSYDLFVFFFLIRVRSVVTVAKLKTKLCGLSPRANYNVRGIAACRRS